MPRACEVCNHDNKLDIDRLLIQGRSMKGISRQFNVSENSLAHHRDRHLTRQLVKAYEMKEEREAKSLLDEMETLITRAKGILDKAEARGHLNTALNAIREVRGTVELLAKMLVVMQGQPPEEGVRGDEPYDLSNLNREELELLQALLAKASGGPTYDMAAIEYHAPSPTPVFRGHEAGGASTLPIPSRPLHRRRGEAQKPHTRPNDLVEEPVTSEEAPEAPLPEPEPAKQPKRPTPFFDAVKAGRVGRPGDFD